jgi:NDP-sugar pyrophosphorylase family protein
MRYLIPMAADSDLFPKSEFHFPKPLIEINGRPMIAHVIDGIRRFDAEAEFIFIVKKSDADQFTMETSLSLLTDGKSTVVKLVAATKGSACTALMAIDEIDDDAPLVICNSDQVLEADIGAINGEFLTSGAAAAVITFSSVHPRWSYARVDDNGLINEVAEKRVLSRNAIAGYYFFRRGRDFIAAAQKSIENGADVGGNFFIAPTLNEVILTGGRVAYHEIDENAYHSLYSPHRVEAYERWLDSAAAKTNGALKQKLQIVIPMAGLGSRFSTAGYTKPKPFIDVLGKPMIERVLANLKTPNATFILLARQEHLDAEPEMVRDLLSRGDIKIVPVEKVTEGAACTIALARAFLDPNAPVLIANCDQIIDFQCAEYIRDAVEKNLDGSILVFKDVHRDPKWSFAKLGDDGFVAEVKEKVAISDLATVGLYYFKKAQQFFDAALDMIAQNERVNSEFYVCPVYNFMIKAALKVGIYKIPAAAMHGIGTPDDLANYINLVKGRT